MSSVAKTLSPSHNTPPYDLLSIPYVTDAGVSLHLSLLYFCFAVFWEKVIISFEGEKVYHQLIIST